MKLILYTFATLIVPAVVNAACYADYKAKQDDPLRLHYGVVQINGACDRVSAKAELVSRLSQEGWTVLNVLSVFDETGLEERRENAGDFFLRF